MKIHKITWQGTLQGEIDIEASSAQESRQKLENISRQELIKLSTIWNNDQPLTIENVQGYVDPDTWDLIETD